MKKIRLVSLCFSIALAGCGGGGTNSASSTISDSHQTQPNNTAVQTDTSPSAGDSTTSTTASSSTTTNTTTTTTRVSAVQKPIAWKIEDLGFPDDGSLNLRVELSENGKFLFISRTSGYTQSSYVLENGQITQLTHTARHVFAHGMDATGRVLARSYDLEGVRGGPNEINTTYFIYANGQNQALDVSAASRVSPESLGINNAGQITMTAELPGQTTYTRVLYNNGAFKVLGNPNLTYQLDEQGNVVNAIDPAVLRAQINQIAGLQHSAYPYTEAAPRAENKAGQMAGTATRYNGDSVDYELFVYRGNAIGILGPGYAQAMNNQGQIVGGQYSTTQSPHRAILFDGEQIIDLNSLPDIQKNGWMLSVATDINDKGQIVGVGYINAERRAFLLTPIFQ